METYRVKISDLSEDERPREKLLAKGIQSLSNSELIAILIGSGYKELNAVDLARSILKDFDNDINKLAKQSVQELMKYKGIGEAKAISIVSALELGRRRKQEETPEAKSINTSQQVYEILKVYLQDLHHEEFWIILLNRANKLIKVEQISSGGMTGTVADPKMIFKKALDHKAVSIILAHNHPSGNLSPSSQDIKLTTQLINAGKIIDIPVLDHIIFTDQGYYSFNDKGMLV